MTGTVRRPRELTTSFFDVLVHDEPEEEPARLIISGVAPSNDVDTTSDWSIGIDTEENVIVYADWGPLGCDRGGSSGVLGVMVFGIPGLILSSPVLLLAHGFYGAQRLATGMDRHSWALFMRLVPQLEFDDGVCLHEALLNMHNGVSDAYMQRKRDERDTKVRQAKKA